MVNKLHVNVSSYNISLNKTKNITSNELFSTFSVDGNNYEIKNISDSKKEGLKLGLNIRNSVPIYYLKGVGGLRKGAYSPENNIILVFENTDDITLKHEIIHSIEFNKPIPDELLGFYELAKEKISEESFNDNFVSFNFRKNIHEFIADGYSKQPFIEALKNEGLYDKFLEETKYIFE